MASEDSDQIMPGFLAVHRLSDLRDVRQPLTSEVPARGDHLHASGELLKIVPLSRTQLVAPKERNNRSQELIATRDVVLRQVFPVVVMPTVHEDPPDTKEVPKAFKTRLATRSLRDDKPMEHLIASPVAAPTTPARLPDETDREASFSVYKTSNPADPYQPFLLVFRTPRIVTAHDRSLGRVPDRYSGFPAYSRMLTVPLPARRATIYLRTVIVTAAVYRGLVSVLRGRSR
jgi:hypothetical protein